jgi:Subunit 11 of the general transcription factor TFIIH
MLIRKMSGTRKVSARSEKPSLLASPSPSLPPTNGAISTPSLPEPRHRPLRAGSQKEVAFINYVDSNILQVNRRYAKKFSSDKDETDDEARGYEDFEEVVEDLEHVLDTVWVSGTGKRGLLHILPATGPLATTVLSIPSSR